MKYLSGILGFLALLVVQTRPVMAQDYEPFAIVELFTSQGCSSCPRADKYLSEIIKGANSKDQRIIALSFHVDYWDRLGWKDPYSSKTNTQRQYAYATAMKSSNVYTPQMVINGQTEFVGGDRSTGRYEIEKALKQPARKHIEITNAALEGSHVNISYQITGNQLSEVDLYAVLIERDITTRVGRGENGGRQLSHDNVVRTFNRYQEINNSPGSLKLEIPEDLIAANASIVLFTQIKQQGMIDGASMADFPGK